MTFKELLHSVDQEKVFEALRKHYPEDDIDYTEMYTTLLGLEVEKTPPHKYLRVRYVTEDYSWMEEPCEPESYWEADAWSNGTEYGISLSPWSTLLGLTVQYECNEVDAVAHLVWEITFHGLSEERIGDFRDMLMNRIDIVKSGKVKTISFEELKAKFDKEKLDIK